jgi:hypothetical protein
MERNIQRLNKRPLITSQFASADPHGVRIMLDELGAPCDDLHLKVVVHSGKRVAQADHAGSYRSMDVERSHFVSRHAGKRVLIVFNTNSIDT